MKNHFFVAYFREKRDGANVDFIPFYFLSGTKSDIDLCVYIPPMPRS